MVDHHTLLAPRLDLRNYGPDGLEWGYGEAGPAQLALALVADFLQDDERALAVHQQFKRKVVWRLSSDRWELGAEDVAKVLDVLETQTAREHLTDLLGVVMKATCHACGRRQTFWDHDRAAVLAHIDQSGWSESLGPGGELRFTCSECIGR
jgi:hypothetical protein